MGGSFLRFRPLELRRAAPIRGGGSGNASLTALVVVGKTMSPSLKPSRFTLAADRTRELTQQLRAAGVPV